MDPVALVFPGQGAQSVGMGRSLYQCSPAARAVFSQSDEALSNDARPLSSLCFDGPESDLTLTVHTQPAVLTVSLAALAALRERIPTLSPRAYAGHSLGEYTALVAAGSLDPRAAVSLVRLRGRAMQDAVPEGEGAMSAVLLLDDAVVQEICDSVRLERPGRVVAPANYNAPGQVVVAGHADAVAEVGKRVVARRGRWSPLRVSAPFHCALMEPAAGALKSALGAVTFGALRAPVVANVDAMANTDPSRVPELLVRQVAGAVRWSDCVRTLVDMGVTTMVEVGPGKVLAGLIKRVHKAVRVLNVYDAESLDATVAGLCNGGTPG